MDGLLASSRLPDGTMDYPLTIVSLNLRAYPNRADVEMPVYWQAYRIRDGLVIRVEPYKVKAEALEAAGQSEDVPTASS
jgi:hypothetical protein